MKYYLNSCHVKVKLLQGQFQNQPPIGWLKKYKIENKILLYGTVTYITPLLLHIVGHPHLGTCTVTLVFVVTRQRTVPPSYAASC